MKVKIIGHNRELFSKPLKNNPWYAFFTQIEKTGLKISNSSLEGRYDALIANSHCKKTIRECKKFGVGRDKRILILWEPKEVNGKLYKKSTLSEYGNIFTPSTDWLSGDNVHKFNWPQGKPTQPTQANSKWLNRKNKFVLISSNKYSISRGELYSLRRQVMKNQESRRIIDLFGHGWNKNFITDFKSLGSSLVKTNYRNYSFRALRLFAKKYSSYNGIAINKQSTLNKYKFALIIENSRNYISEKLFESLNSQCIVVYVGASLQSNFLNKNIAIEAKADYLSIISKINYVLNLSNFEQLALMKKQRNEYLKTNSDWNNYNVLGNLAQKSAHLLNINHSPTRKF